MTIFVCYVVVTSYLSCPDEDSSSVFETVPPEELQGRKYT